MDEKENNLLITDSILFHGQHDPELHTAPAFMEFIDKFTYQYRVFEAKDVQVFGDPKYSYNKY